VSVVRFVFGRLISPLWVFDLSEVRFVSPQTYRERVARLEPRPGDVVYSREGGILGIACVIPEGLRACLGQRMMIMRCRSDAMRPGFLCHVLNSPVILEGVRELTSGTASPHLNVGDIKQFPVPIPTLREQGEVLRRGDALLQLTDTLEKQLSSASARVGTLGQAILAKAFRGELVPTEAELARQEGRDYEPAAVLLELIRSQSSQVTRSHSRASRQSNKQNG